MKLHRLVDKLQASEFRTRFSVVRVVTGPGDDSAWAYDIKSVAELPDGTVALFVSRTDIAKSYDTTAWNKRLSKAFFSALKNTGRPRPLGKKVAP